MIIESSLFNFPSKIRSMGKIITKFIITKSFLVNVASTMTFPESSAVNPVKRLKSTIDAPMTFPNESWGVVSMTELRPTKNSGVELATPKIIKETIKVLKRNVLAILIRFWTTTEADLASTSKLTKRIKN